MTNINLLPWREEQRRERNRETLFMCGLIWALAMLIVFVGKVIMDSRIESQNERNAYLQSEINGLSKVIKEIENLKGQRDKLLARMDVIQSLQTNRSQIVHVFDDLVSKLPDGVFYDTISKRDNKLTIAGKAQSNSRVSALMRNLDSSDWFGTTSLKVVDVIDQNGASVSSFSVEVSEEKQESTNEIE